MSSSVSTASAIDTFKTLLTSMADSIAEDLDRARRQGTLAVEERSILSEFETRSIRARKYFLAAAVGHESAALFLEGFHRRSIPSEQPDATEIAALLAATVEANGRRWLSDGDGAALAASLEAAGAVFARRRLYLFAENAYRQAAALHRRFDNVRAEDRCAYKRADAHRRSLPRAGAARLVADLSAGLFGYGYRPLRLLVWIAALIAGFAAWLIALPRTGGATEAEAVYVALQDFLNPTGLGDVKYLSGPWKPVLLAETYTGDVFRNLFFVLLIRRLFRL